MALSREQLNLASDVVETAPSVREAAAQWRAQNPQVRAIVVDALDMRGEIPALQLGTRSVYLAASHGHCWHVTARPEEATVLILTQN